MTIFKVDIYDPRHDKLLASLLPGQSILPDDLQRLSGNIQRELENTALEIYQTHLSISTELDTDVIRGSEGSVVIPRSQRARLEVHEDETARLYGQDETILITLQVRRTSA